MTAGPNFAQGLFNRPIALLPSSRHLAIRMFEQYLAAAPRAYGGDIAEKPWRPFDVVAGVAIIPVQGILIQRVGPYAWLAEMMGVAGYDYIRLMFLQALADPDIDAIVLAISSPGGDVAGCFDLADTIYAGRGVKPIWSILDEVAYSSAYALASAADPGRIYVPRTGGTGSVGVVWMHVSIEEALKKEGVEVTLITKGDLKWDASEYTALSKDAYARIKAEVLTVGALFDATVARNRGMAVKDVTATQAGTFMGAAGVEVGFADHVMAPDFAFRALLKELG